MTNPAAGWYKDPKNELQQRLWDGERWTEQARPLPPTASLSMPPPATYAASPVYRPRRGNFFSSHRALTIIGGIVAAFILIGIVVGAAGNGNNPVANVPTTAGGTATTSGSTATTQPSNSHIMSFQDMNGVPYTVDLLNVTDPAKGSDQFNYPDPGNRFVSVLFKITDTGKQSTSDSADNNTTIVGSNNQTYQTDLSTVAGCTDFNSGSYQLNPGQSTTGCLTFQLPKAVSLKKIEWSPSSGFSNDFGTWDITG